MVQPFPSVSMYISPPHHPRSAPRLPSCGRASGSVDLPRARPWRLILQLSPQGRAGQGRAGQGGPSWGDDQMAALPAGARRRRRLAPTPTGRTLLTPPPPQKGRGDVPWAVHLLRLRRRGDEHPRGRRACDVQVLVLPLADVGGEALGALVAQVLVIVQGVWEWMFSFPWIRKRGQESRSSCRFLAGFFGGLQKRAHLWGFQK
eukprot:gene678-biopygen9014